MEENNNCVPKAPPYRQTHVDSHTIQFPTSQQGLTAPGWNRKEQTTEGAPCGPTSIDIQALQLGSEVRTIANTSHSYHSLFAFPKQDSNFEIQGAWPPKLSLPAPNGPSKHWVCSFGHLAECDAYSLQKMLTSAPSRLVGSFPDMVQLFIYLFMC